MRRLGLLLGLAVAAPPVPTPIGAGPRYHPPAAPKRVLQGRAVGQLRCGVAGQRFGVHLELFARGRVVIVPAGVGVAAPRHRVGAFVRPAGCTYAARTLEPTGVVEVRRGARLGAIPLRRHAEIVLELGGFVPPHGSFRFHRGL